MALRAVQSKAASEPDPLLETGDRLSRDEFERRYERMPHVKKAELIEGTVFMPSRVRAHKHAEPAKTGRLKPDSKPAIHSTRRCSIA